MEDRVAKLEAERAAEEKRFDSLLADGTFVERKASLARLHELDAEIAEARGSSLTGDGMARL